MFLPTLLVCVVTLSYVEAGYLKPKYCNDCMPYTYCKKAKNLADEEKTEHTKQLFRNAYCGFFDANTVKICCSDFDTPSIGERWSQTSMLPTTDSCGNIARDRVVGGVDAGLYEFPWMVVIAYGDEKKFGCSGTLISSQYVLTAAHCVVNKDINFVRIGDYNLLQELDCIANVCEKHIQEKNVTAFISHDGFEWNTYKNDIALLRLDSPVELPLKNADVICLPTTPELQETPIRNKQATVAGWGLNEHGNIFSILHKVEIPVRPATFCQSYYSHITGSSPSQFCAGLPHKDSCRGDSGGPLMIEIDVDGQTKIFQYGIVSNGPITCGEDAPGIYTDIRKYMTWIMRNIRE